MTNTRLINEEPKRPIYRKKFTVEIDFDEADDKSIAAFIKELKGIPARVAETYWVSRLCEIIENK